jgi:hypothetical protein
MFAALFGGPQVQPWPNMETSDRPDRFESIAPVSPVESKRKFWPGRVQQFTVKSTVLPAVSVSTTEKGVSVLTVSQVLPLPGLQMNVENTEVPFTRMLSVVLVESKAE